MRPPLAMLLGVALALSAVRGEARAAGTCEADHLAAQKDRESGALLRAREELLRCSAAACPSLVQGDCEKWLESVTADVPTVVPSARTSDGVDLRDVRVSLDDAPWLESLEGKALSIDPGPHVLRFESKALGAIEVSIVAKTGARNEPVVATFAAPKPRGRARAATIATWSLVGAGGLGLLGFAGLSIAGEVQFHHLKTTCAPSCSHRDVERVRSQLIAGDVSLALGSALLGAGLVVFLATSSSPDSPTAPKPSALYLRPAPGGASAGAVFTF